MLHLVIARPLLPSQSGFLKVVKILLATNIDINATDDEGWTAQHVVASQRSYDILCEIMNTYGCFVWIGAKINDGELAHGLS